MLRFAVGLMATGLCGVLGAGANGPAPETVTAETSEMKLAAKLIADKDQQVKLVGSDLKRQYVIVEVTVTPRGGYPVTIARDEFLLRSERDNERATPDSPDRVAGEAVLVLGAKGGSRPVYSQSNDPVFVGGLPGTGGGLPQRVGGDGGSFGGGGGEAGQTTVSASRTKATPLLDALWAKELPLGKTGRPVTGYLYFPVDPNQKTKNFHLHFKGTAGTCELRFK